MIMEWPTGLFSPTPTELAQMNLLYFSVYDGAAKLFLEPFVSQTVETACRSFRQIVNKADHQFNRFPEDYTLFQLGAFNQETGEFTSLDTPQSLGNALQYKEDANGSQREIRLAKGE